MLNSVSYIWQLVPERRLINNTETKLDNIASASLNCIGNQLSYYYLRSCYSKSCVCCLSASPWEDKIWTGCLKKGSPVHVAPACAGSGEGPDHFGSIVRRLSLHFCKRLFPGLEPVTIMTSWSQGSSFTTAPRLPFVETRVSFTK